MSLSVRIIPCLDVTDGRVVKGVNFTDLRDAGDPVEMAALYGREGADELTFLDISASAAGRETTLDVVRRTAEQVFIPLTVGGGIRTVEDVNQLLRAGADKVSINTAALVRPELIAEISDRFGSQVLVLSVDARRANTDSGFEVTTHGGRESAGIDALAWVEKACALGVGEILLNSMDADGTRAAALRRKRLQPAGGLERERCRHVAVHAGHRQGFRPDAEHVPRRPARRAGLDPGRARLPRAAEPPVQ